MNSFRHRLPAAIERLDAMPALTESRNRVLRVLLEVDVREEDLITAIESDVALVVADGVLRVADPSLIPALGALAERGRIETASDVPRWISDQPSRVESERERRRRSSVSSRIAR